VLLVDGREKSIDVENSVMRLGIKIVLDLDYTIHLPAVFKKLIGKIY
jgi:hypothetical protein